MSDFRDVVAERSWTHLFEFIDYFVDPVTAAGAHALADSPHLGRLSALLLHRNGVGDEGAKPPRRRRDQQPSGPDGPAGVGPRSGLAPAGRGRSPR